MPSYTPSDAPFAARSLAGCALVVFDFDGTIADTAKLQYLGWRKALAPLLEEIGQPPITEPENLQYLNGHAPAVGVPALLRSRGIAPDTLQIDYDTIGEEKSAFTTAWLKEPGARVEVYQDVLDIACELRRAGKLVAIASSSRSAGLMVDKLRLRHEFDYVMDGTMRHSFNLGAKPEPDTLTYVQDALAREKGTDIRSQKCAMIGDTPADITAARRAGYKIAIGFNPHKDAQLDDALHESGANFVYTDMSALSRAVRTTLRPESRYIRPKAARRGFG